MGEEEFEERLACLNALYGSSCDGAHHLTPVESRKDHIDVFGAKIEEGEIYYRRHRETGPGYDVFKVSRQSMETILELIFYRNEGLQSLAGDIGRKIKELDDEKLIEAFSKLEGLLKSPDKPPPSKRQTPQRKPSDKPRPRPDGIKRIK